MRILPYIGAEVSDLQMPKMWINGADEKEQTMSDLIRRQDAELILAREMYATSLKAGCDPVSPMDFLPEARAWLSDAPAICGWIPVTERLPESSGAYLVRPSDGALEDYSDLDAVMIIPYEADAEAFGWWTERFDPVSLGCIGSDFYEVEVIAWMPLPEPYKYEEADDDSV